MEDNKNSGCQRWGEVNRQSTENFQGSENTLYDIIMMEMPYGKNAIPWSKPIVCTTPKVNSRANWTLGDYDVQMQVYPW